MFPGAAQGFLLRLIGLNQRKTQRNYLRTVSKFGLDPISFVLSPSVQLAQLKEDWRSVKRELWVEYTSWREGGLDYYHRDTVKRELMKKLVADSTVKQGDAVKIIAPRLDETGLTAYLMQLDRTVPGKTVAEVRMDQTDRNAFFPLVTDGDKYNPPLTAIKTVEKSVKPPMDVDGVRDNSDNILVWARKERPRLEASIAACVIQRSYRLHLSRIRGKPGERYQRAPPRVAISPFFTPV